LLAWGDSARAHGRSGQALEWYLLASEAEPSSSLAWYRVGQEYNGQAHWEEALTAFRRALEADAWASLDVERADAYHQGALLLFRKGSWSEVSSLLRQALAVTPDSADLWGDLAWASYQSGEGLEQALTQMQRALELAPSDVDLLVRAADLYRLENKYDEALEWVTRARAVEPGNVWVLIAQGRIEFDRGDYTQGIRTFSDAIHLSPDTARAHFWLGRAYQANDQWVDAIGAYETAFELMPGQIEFGLWLGDAYCQMGKLDEAVATYQQVLAHNPDHQGAQRRLQETLEQE
jgi:tetratricopeptide (TPR) repeat protein